MPRSAIERVFFSKAETTAYIYPETGIGPPVEDKREVSFFWSMNAVVAKSFFDIPDDYGLPPENLDSMLEVENSSRTTHLIGGTAGTTNVAKHFRSRGIYTKQGSKSVILFTGRPTKDGSRRKSIITCRFPSWVIAQAIADVLGQTIPSTKIKEVPTAADIRPYFKVKGGLTYRILTKAAADATTNIAVADSQANANLIGAATKQGRGKKT